MGKKRKKNGEEYFTIKIPIRLKNLIEELIHSEIRFPYRSVGEFVIESARLRYFELKKEIEERRKKGMGEYGEGERKEEREEE